MKYILLLSLAVYAHAISKQSIYLHAREFTKYPSTILAMAGVESSYCKNVLGDDGTSLGCLQMQVDTTLWIATKYSDLAWLLRISKKNLQTLLLRNDALNIEIACKLFEYHRERYGYYEAVKRHNSKYMLNNNGKRVPNTRYPKKVFAEMKRNKEIR